MRPTRTVRGKIIVPEKYDPSKVSIEIAVCFSSDPAGKAALFLRHREEQLPWGVYHVNNDGIFEINDLPADNSGWLMAKGPGLGETWARIPIKEELLLTLAPEAIITGKIMHSDGSPVPGLRVWAQPLSDQALPLNAITDQFGKFTIHGLWEDTYDLYPPGLPNKLSHLCVEPIHKISVKTGQTISDADMILKAGIPVRGRVTDSKPNAPIQGVQIWGRSGDMEGARAAATSTDEGGNYEMYLPEGKIHIAIAGWPQGYKLRIPNEARIQENGRIIELKHGDKLIDGIDFMLDPVSHMQ